MSNPIRVFLSSINLDEINFILTIAGFPIVTTLLPFVPSVPYRGFALIISLICLLKNGLHFSHGSKLMKWLLFFCVIVDIKVLIQIVFASSNYHDSAYTALLFTFGITLIPALSVFSGLKKIKWEFTLWILWILLTAVLIVGDISVRDVIIDVGEEQRMSLNERQSTLALGDNGAALCILALSLFFELRNINNKFFKYSILVLLIISLCAGIFGLAKAGSRGPVLSFLVGVCFIAFYMETHKRNRIILLLIATILFFGINLNTLESFAPVLFDRITNTVENGDISGRDVVFAKAWNIITHHPICGGDPLILTRGDSVSGYHNGYLAVGVAAGMWGALLYIYYNFQIILTYWRNRLSQHRAIDYFCVGYFGFFLMRAMSGASIIMNPTYLVALGLVSYFLCGNHSSTFKNYEHSSF